MSRSAESIFQTARKKTSPGERAAYLDGACGGDAALRAKVEAFLKADVEAGSFLRARAQESEPADGDDPNATIPQSASAAHSRRDAPQSETPGQMIGRYKLLQEIGEGGFGSVWMAEQEQPVRRRVALKIIKLGMDTRQVVARFEQERQALAMMDHPNIARVLDAGATDTGRPYFVMDLVKGDPIAEYCDKNNLSIHDRLELFAQVCTAVQHAHTKGIIHRDIKPSNILVSTQDGRPHAKVIDFGIAKATASKLTEKTLFTEHKALIGTPEYMSPEQAEGSLDIDTRTDVYSLGVLLYELLTGTTPFSSKELRSAAYAEMQRIIREVEPPKPSTRLAQSAGTLASVAAKRHTEPRRLGAIVRGELDWIVMKALEKDRQRRYETANGLALDIRRYLSDEAVVAAPPSTAYRLRKFVRRNKAAVLAGSAVAAVLLLGIVGTSYGMVRALNEKQRADDEATRATLAAESEATAKVQAQDNERRAVAEAKRAEAAAEAETKARVRAETISEFVTTALKSSDAQNAGGGQEMTILAAMDNAIKDIDSGRFKDDPETEAGLKDTIAMILQNNGRLADAEPLFVQALDINQRLHTGDHPNVATDLGNVASVRMKLGRTAEAEPLFVQALEMRQRLFKDDHPDVANGLNNLAAVREALGRVAEAEPPFVQALEMRQRLFKGDHPDVANGLNNLAAVRHRLGRLAEAELLYVQALEMNQRLFKDDHPEVAKFLNNLAGVRQALGRLAEAEPLFVQSLEMRQRLFKGDHPSVASSLNNLADVRRALGRAAEAEPLYVRALEMYQRLFKGDHPSVATSLNNVAFVRLSLGRAAEAEPLFVQALEVYQRLYKGDHPDVPSGLSNLARTRQALGKTAEARQGFDEAVAMRRRLSPTGSPDLARVLWRSGSARLDTEGAAAALPELEKAVAMAEKFLPPEHPQLEEYRETLAKCKTVLGK